MTTGEANAMERRFLLLSERRGYAMLCRATGEAPVSVRGWKGGRERQRVY